MLQDFTKHTQTVTLGKKEYKFEYDYSALAALQKESGKSPYDIYDLLLKKNNLMLDDSISLVCCAMLKHHDEEEIIDFKDKLQRSPGLWNSVREAVVSSFILPMLPPEIMRNMIDSKKKAPKKTAKKK